MIYFHFHIGVFAMFGVETVFAKNQFKTSNISLHEVLVLSCPSTNLASHSNEFVSIVSLCC